jgi:hypothetical protein
MQINIDFEVGRQLGEPKIKILIDDYIVLYEGNAIDNFSKKFDINYGEHELKIVHHGKTDGDHLYNPNGSIAVDKYIFIKSIIIDDVKLNDKELQSGQFWPVYSLSYVETMTAQGKDLPGFISPNLYLGHNGTWKYTFVYPFIDWIITKKQNGPQLKNTIFKTSNEILQEAKNFFSDIIEI